MDRILGRNPKTRGVPGAIDADKMVNTGDLNQLAKTKEDSILGQEAKGKRKQKEEYSDALLKPFEKAYLADISKFHEEHMAIERKKITIMEDIRNYICSGVGVKGL